MIRQRTLGLAAFGIALVTIATAGSVWAGRNDLKLVNLCTTPVGVECPWIQRAGSTFRVDPDSQGLTDFRSLMSELGVVMAPRIPMPADTLGFAGFQIDGEISFTQISNNRPFWNGVSAVTPRNPTSSRPDSFLTTLGVFARKGIWFPAPSFEVGGGVVNLLQSQMLAWQIYAKLALHEGYHDLPFPSLAVRAALSYLTGTDQVNLTTTSFDVLISKSFGLLKTARIEPFGGWSLVLIKASGKPIDFTALAPGGTTSDQRTIYAFPGQDVITRYRLFGGAKLKFGVLAIIAQYELYLAGNSRDHDVKTAVDQSGRQSAFSLSVGLAF